MTVRESNNNIFIRYGHNWNLTTADNFRRCDRSECSAVERLVNGVWASVDVRQGKKKKSGGNSKFVPQSLF
jgi:hypothetical protein